MRTIIRLSLLLSLILILGCGILEVKQETETVLIQTTAYTIAVQTSRQDPGIVPHANAFCMAIIQSDEENFLPIFETGIKFLGDRYKSDQMITGNIKYIGGLLKTGEKIDYVKVRIAAMAFMNGLK